MHLTFPPVSKSSVSLFKKADVRHIKLLNVLLVLVFIFLFQSSLSRELLPHWINVIGVFSSIALNLYFILKKRRQFLLFGVYTIFCFLSVVSLAIFDEDITDLKVWSFLIMLTFAFNLRHHIVKYIPWTKLFLILNLAALIWEKIEGRFVFIPDTASGISMMSPYYYGQGLGTYAKGTGEFLAISMLLFRNNNIMKFIIFISTLFTGIRSAIAIAAVIILFDFIFSLKLSKSGIISMISFSVILMTGIWLGSDGIIYAGRYLSAFNLSTPTYVDRWWIMSEHIKCYSNLPVFQQFFGSGFYCGKIHMWGSESLPIQMFTYYGAFFFLAYLFLLIALVVRIIKFPAEFVDLYPFLLVFMMSTVVRFPLGWFGGTVFFGLLFIALFEKQKWQRLRDQIGFKYGKKY